MGSIREIKGWLLSVVGVVGLMILTIDNVENSMPPLIIQILRWFVWGCIVLGVLEAMQIIRIFNYDNRNK